jgi:WD40 repeat protein
LTIWDLAAGRPTFSVPRPANDMVWSGPCDDEPACTLVTIGESVDAWQPLTRRHVELVDQTNAQAVAISADSTTVVTAGWGPTVAVWQLRPIVDDSGRTKVAPAPSAAEQGQHCVTSEAELQAASPDGTLVVSQTDDRTTTVCDTRNGSIVAAARISGATDPTDALAVDDEGNLAVGGGRGFVERYRRDGATFAPGRAIDVRLGSEPASVSSLAYRAGTIAAGIRPASADAVARVFIWPADEAGTPAQFDADYQQVPAIALLGDEAQDLVVAGRDRDDGPVTLQIWETASRRRLGHALRGLSGTVTSLTGNESSVVAADANGNAYRWQLDRDPTRDICSIVGRPMTATEWATLAGGALAGYRRDEVCATSSPVD